MSAGSFPGDMRAHKSGEEACEVVDLLRQVFTVTVHGVSYQSQCGC